MAAVRPLQGRGVLRFQCGRYAEGYAKYIRALLHHRDGKRTGVVSLHACDDAEQEESAQADQSGAHTHYFIRLLQT